MTTHSQLYRRESPILTVKHVAPLRQYQVAYAGGHSYVWNVMLGRCVGAGGLGFGVVREEHASGTNENGSLARRAHIIYSTPLRMMTV